MTPRKFFIYKVDGKRVKFNENEILSTCMRVGASKQTAKRILRKVKSEVPKNMTSNDIYKKVLHVILQERGLKVLHRSYQSEDTIIKKFTILIHLMDLFLMIKRKIFWYCQNLRIQFFGLIESGFFTE